MSLAICLFAFVFAYLAGRRSLVYGVATVLGVGYIYGLVRANIVETASYFIFDAAVLGFYCAQLFRSLTPDEELRVRRLRPWVEILIAWPIIMFFVPQQDILIRIVGLRGNVFMLPFLLIGARMGAGDRYRLALWLAAFNIVAFTIASIEYLYGVPLLFPRNQMTQIIYQSTVFATGNVLRIPSSFVSPHAFAGAMVMTIPFLAGALVQPHKRDWHKPLLVASVMAALLGVFMSATRLNFIVASLLVIVILFSLRLRFAYVLGWLIVVLVVGWLVSGEQRMQRFTELQDTKMVSERVSGSINMDFFELMTTYPFGNGLGGGGTNIPAFLQNRISNSVVMENEYARILLEQGIVGLILWITFLAWLFIRTLKMDSDNWLLGRRLAWCACLAFFGISIAGVGLFVSIPQTCLVMLCVGWIGSARPSEHLALEPSLSDRSSKSIEVT
jgi:hypothetical protein